MLSLLVGRHRSQPYLFGSVTYKRSSSFCLMHAAESGQTTKGRADKMREGGLICTSGTSQSEEWLQSVTTYGLRLFKFQIFTCDFYVKQHIRLRPMGVCQRQKKDCCNSPGRKSCEKNLRPHYITTGGKENGKETRNRNSTNRR